MDFDRRPILVFWESTRACGLACRHCRAEAIERQLPGELTPDEALRLVDALASFGSPRPVLIATGGDVLMRRDLDAVAARAAECRVPLALAPSVTPRLDARRVASLGVKIASISVDGATAATHDGIRGVPGHFAATLDAIARLRAERVTVQVNSVVMRDTLDELPALAELVARSGAAVWELFFLVHVGRGRALAELTPAENEDVCHFLVDASRHGFVVRTVEAPFFRRVAAGEGLPAGGLYRRLAAELEARLGPPHGRSRAQTKGTRDGRGIVFVGHDGTIAPSGFLPLALGNVREDDLAEVYREHPLLRRIRDAELAGRCGGCAFRELCGGSRARAYAATGDPLADDPGCAVGILH